MGLGVMSLKRARLCTALRPTAVEVAAAESELRTRTQNCSGHPLLRVTMGLQTRESELQAGSEMREFEWVYGAPDLNKCLL